MDGYGINQATLFADLDGLAGYITWERLHKYDEPAECMGLKEQ
jgi:hypothetical protein